MLPEIFERRSGRLPQGQALAIFERRPAGSPEARLSLFRIEPAATLAPEVSQIISCKRLLCPAGYHIAIRGRLQWLAEAVEVRLGKGGIFRGSRLRQALGRPSLTVSASRRLVICGWGGAYRRTMASFRHSIPFMLSATALLAERLRK
ncbi:hypothetical protein [Bradyrhizobium centrosematis]|uniref:hypothetical protein n=1 Tax=Bradyrhizobium centrosematis TaxID=1300039 RepID=UPI0038902F6B